MKKPVNLTIVLSDEEFVIAEAEFLAVHDVLCDAMLDNCVVCRDLCCPEGTCGLGGGWAQTYAGTYYQPAEFEAACPSHDPESNDYYDEDDRY